MKPRLKTSSFVTIMLAAVLVLSACVPAAASAPTATSAPVSAPAGNAGTITIGSKDFTEEFIVAEMYAQVLENAGFKVNRKLNLGGTPVAQAAIVKGDIDLYPEYTSTALLTVLKAQPIQDPTQIYQAVKSGYEKQFNLTWLTPSPFNDTQALAMTQAGATKYGIKTYSDLAQKASQLVIGGPAEFFSREDGLPALQKAYGGFQFKDSKQLGTGSLRYQALIGGQIDVVVAFSTDGEINGDKLALLQDDKNFYPVYNVAPVIRMDTLTKYPQIATVLDKLAPYLTTPIMSGLNWEVDGPDKKEPAAVAKAFLQQNGLLK
ncbi:MAG: glycine betaine ABC transporter substrate-binding protein [Anaerolineaceae bacterium]|nr:glycine betaine ABC transporter substrate-binding protein [Anaerolineaceae bacterium]